MARRNGQNPRPWTPLQPATYKTPEAVKLAEASGATVWMNDSHTVAATPLDREVGMDGPVHLSIKRNDRKPIRDWRIMQRIKNEVVGQEREAYEAYPAESMLIDESNQYHLWVLPKGSVLPFGFADRMVGSSERAAEAGARQRPFDDDVTPADIDDHIGATGVALRPWKELVR